MPLEELAQVDRVIALAGGEAKTEAIHGALRTGCIDVLITDVFTGARLAEASDTAK
jgi:DNA-binding transcriptional regulator LsrR (DeoR family)